MTDAVWPITNTLVHTRGGKTEVAVNRLPPGHAVLTMRFGGVMDVTIHTHSMEEIIDIHRQLGLALDALKKEDSDV